MIDTEFFKFIQDNLGYSGLVLIGIILFVLYIPKFIDSFGYLKNIKIRHLNDALSSEYIDDDTRVILSEKLSIIYFEKCIGSTTSYEKNRYVLTAYEIFDGKFNMSKIHQSLNYLPCGFHMLPRNRLEHINKSILEQEKSLEKHRKLMVLLIVASMAGFVFSTLDAYQGNSFFTYEYYNTGVLYVFELIFLIYFYIDVIKKINEIEETTKIIDYVVLEPDDIEC
ncbi:hypothetical protein [Psychrobacter pygoscelis]|uniref:hypothetical protein n=1 Tax=Psychrobacter pygoscelis TaxID=2488563 RepID=UPI00103E45F9|nr:hypothetical protein [Psychrobacter pygoscelis]